jgi:uncharacterized protein (DUF1810 family)
MSGHDLKRPDLARFHAAQDRGMIWHQALDELRCGQKQSHWMWFIFPQLAGLGHSSTARFYAIANIAEARAYLADPLLGARLVTTTQAVLHWAGERTAREIFGPVDALKFVSCMTLFEAAGGEACFARALYVFADGQRDTLTLTLLAAPET